MKKQRGIFITFEGTEGCGKSTHSARIVDYLKEKGHKILFTREPGGTRLAEEIRKLLLNADKKVLPLTELFLYEACRTQHMEEVIKPALKAGKIVICDRFIDSTVAYQSFGRGLDIKIVERLNGIASGGIIPDLTVIIDIPVVKGLAIARLASSGAGGDRLENENIVFHKRVQKGFKHQFRRYPSRIKTVKQMERPEDTFLKVKSVVEDFIKRKQSK